MNTWKAFLKGTRLDRYDDGSSNDIRPLSTIDLDIDDEVLSWHGKNVNRLEDLQNARTSSYTRNRDLFAGLHGSFLGRVGTSGEVLSDRVYSQFRMPEIIVNHSYELTEQWVAKLSRFSTAVEVLPQNPDEPKRNAARMSQQWCEYLSEVNDFPDLFLRFIRDSRIGGESYIFIDYDPNVGDLMPDSKRAKEKGLRVPLKNPDTKEHIIGEDGSPLYIEHLPRVGDLVYRLRSVPEVMVQPKKAWKDVEWVCEIDLVDVDELKMQYPEKSGSISQAALVRDIKEDAEIRAELSKLAFVYTYWHRRTSSMDSGRKMVLLDNCVLYNDVNPFPDAPLPVVRLTDIDIEGELHGWSFLNNIGPLQIALNKLYTLWYKNIALGSHLYWLIPANARVARDKIRNSASVIQYHGVQEPKIATFTTVRPELMTLVDKLEARILTISRIQSTSRGELPPNVEAGVAIEMLEEQETQAASHDIKKVNAAVEKLYKISLAIAGDKYTKADGRTLRILGREGEYLAESLDHTKLAGPYDVRVKKTTALSQSKPLMVKQITQLEAMRPGLFTTAELYDLLELGDRDKFYEAATAGKRTAELENEMFRDNKEVAEPTPDEYHLVHYESHLLMLQSPSFKMNVDKDVKEAVKEHVRVTEFYLVEKAKKNLALATKLAALEYFPAFYVPDFSIPQILAALNTGASLPQMGEIPPEEPGALPLDVTNPTAPDGSAEPALPGAAPDLMQMEPGLNGEAPQPGSQMGIT